MTSIRNRYASAVHSKSLRPAGRKGSEGTEYLDVDVLGAFGLTAREHPLGVSLERLFTGDHRAAHEIVRILAEMAHIQSWRIGVRAPRTTCHDVACACLAWHRSGTCVACSGHGYDPIPGVPSLSAHQCSSCRGTGKILFDVQFADHLVPLARWLLAEIEREAARVGPAAMVKLAGRMEL